MQVLDVSMMVVIFVVYLLNLLLVHNAVMPRARISFHVVLVVLVITITMFLHFQSWLLIYVYKYVAIMVIDMLDLPCKIIEKSLQSIINYFSFSYQSGYRCFCGNTIQYQSQTSTCTYPCEGNSAQYCGSGSYSSGLGYYISVYSLSKCVIRVK